jgi:putative membrane protein
MISRRTYLAGLAGAFCLIWLALAVSPTSRSDWLLENSPLLVTVVALVASYRALPLSRISYTLIVLFLVLHSIGAHYTYSLVPWAEWARVAGLVGDADSAARNHFDRVVHLLYGLLLAYPIREVLLRVADLRGFWGYFFPIAITLATSALYELAEWGAAELFGGDLGVAFLGTQGDAWDAQKDMALAGIGALVAMAITMVLNYALERDFAREWSESFRVKVPHPLGEDELRRLWHEREGSGEPPTEARSAVRRE